MKVTKAIKEAFPVRDRVCRSGMLGAMIGDISGSAHEGVNSNIFNPSYQFFNRQSTLTDDSVQTAAVAEWLLHRGTLPLKEALLTWARLFPHAGYGSGFRHFIKTGQSYRSNANGAAMRISPVSEYVSSLEEALSLARESAIPTHADGGVKGAQAIAAAAFIARDGVARNKPVADVKREMKEFVKERFGYNLDVTIEELREQSKEYARKRLSAQEGGSTPSECVSIANADLSCPAALIAVLGGETYEQVIRLAVSTGGDSDTIAAMAGSIAAQLYGIPDTLVERALVFLPSEVVEVINAFERLSLTSSKQTPPHCRRWTPRECIVYGEAPEGVSAEEGKAETVLSRFNHHPAQGYPILTVGKTLEEICSGVKGFLRYAKDHPETRFHVRRVGYDKAGYTVEQIATMFRGALELSNVLLPEEMLGEIAG